MPSARRDNRKKYWYKVSVDAVRVWTTIAALLAIGIGGAYGYRLLARHLLEKEVAVAIDESEALLRQLRGDPGVDSYREKVEIARQHLEGARAHYDNDELREASQEAQRCRSLLTSIDDALQHRSPAGEAQFIATKGRVDVRRGERGEWRQARSRMVLYDGDYIKTATNASAEIMMVDGTLFTVRPGTVVLVNRTRSLFGLSSERSLALESGWVNLSTAQSTSRITTPEAEARVRERTEAVVTYNDEAQLGRFSAYRGGLEVAAADGSTQEVGELQQVVQRQGELSAPKPLPDPPAIVAPSDNWTVSLHAADRLTLRWDGVKGATSYSLQVSQNRLFVDNVIEDAGRTKMSATLGIKGEGSFVWRVAAIDAEGQRGPWSPAYRFRVTSPTGVEGSASPRQGG